MNIAIDARVLAAPGYRGGILVYTERLIEHLALIDRDNRYRLLLAGMRLEPADVKVRVGPNFGKQILRVPDRDLPGKRWAWSNLVLPAYFALRPCDVYHLPADSQLPRTRRVRTIITIHDLRGMYDIPGDMPQDVEGFRRSAERADRVVTVSEFTRRDVIEHFGVPPARVRTVHVGMDRPGGPADPARLAALRRELGIDRPYVLALGVTPRKNVERILQAWQRFRGRGEHALVLAGHLADAWWTRKYRAMIRCRGLGDDVVLPGSVSNEQLDLLYTGAHAFLFPSLCEGFGIPVLEAQARGAPVITSDSSALPEVAGDGALFVDARDVDSIVAALERLTADEPLRRQLICAGTRNIERFSWDRMARELRELYLELGR